MSAQKPMNLLLPLLMVSLFCFMLMSPAMAADKETPETLDLSTMDWSDDPEETDFSKETWEDEPSAESLSTANQLTGPLSEMSWEDDEDEDYLTGEEYRGLSVDELDALGIKERRIHYSGFVLFIGYILGGLFTAFFTRNRKLAIDYPPELLIVLHTVWPLEWVFMLFAGKKVR